MASDLGTGDEEFFLHQAYGILPVGQFTVMIGHMDTMLGNEVINPGDNPNITRSFLFGYSINFHVQKKAVVLSFRSVKTDPEEIIVSFISSPVLKIS